MMTMDKASRKSRGQWVARAVCARCSSPGHWQGLQRVRQEECIKQRHAIHAGHPGGECGGGAGGAAGPGRHHATTAPLDCSQSTAPPDFEDFAATANFPIPPPPEGKRYAINSQMHVILVNR
jgi:hypothetical protein